MINNNHHIFRFEIILSQLHTKCTSKIPLELRTFFVGERITLADISLACALILLFEKGLTHHQRSEFVHLLRWFDTIINQPNVKAGCSEFEKPKPFSLLYTYTLTLKGSYQILIKLFILNILMGRLRAYLSQR